MKINPQIRYYTPREMRDMAASVIPEGLIKDKRTIANEFAKKNGFEKTVISISGVRRVYFYKPINQQLCSNSQQRKRLSTMTETK